MWQEQKKSHEPTVSMILLNDKKYMKEIIHELRLIDQMKK